MSECNFMEMSFRIFFLWWGAAFGNFGPVYIIVGGVAFLCIWIKLCPYKNCQICCNVAHSIKGLLFGKSMIKLSCFLELRCS